MLLVVSDTKITLKAIVSEQNSMKSELIMKIDKVEKNLKEKLIILKWLH